MVARVMLVCGIVAGGASRLRLRCTRFHTNAACALCDLWGWGAPSPNRAGPRAHAGVPVSRRQTPAAHLVRSHGSVMACARCPER